MNQATILKFTTDYISNNVDNFGKDSQWSYFEGNTKLTFDEYYMLYMVD